MKKLACSILLAACLPGVAFAEKSKVIDIETFSALSSSASFMLNWVDAISTKTNKTGNVTGTSIIDGSYSLLLTETKSGNVVLEKNNLNLNDTSSSSSGSYQWSFSDLVANRSYTIALTGLWKGVKESNQWSLTTPPSVSITPVPEPETYAMFLAGLGVIGMIARRRKAA